MHYLLNKSIDFLKKKEKKKENTAQTFEQKCLYIYI